MLGSSGRHWPVCPMKIDIDMPLAPADFPRLLARLSALRPMFVFELMLVDIVEEEE